MGWNDNIKRILDFIPVFDRETKKLNELSAQLKKSAAINDELIKSNALLRESNELAMAKVKAISESALEVKSYDDSNIKLQISELSRAVSNFNESIDTITPQQAEIEPYDDTELINRIKKFERLFDSFRRTEREELTRAMSELEKSLKNITDSMSTKGKG